MSFCLAIVGARLNSSRLAGKHLLPLAVDASGLTEPMISHLWRRLMHSKQLDKAVLATTKDDFNQPLVDWAKLSDVECVPFAGDVNDLMARLDAIIQQQQPDYIVYICGDCPLIEPEFIDHALNELMASGMDSIRFKDGVQTLHEGMAFYSKAGWDKLMSVSQCVMSKEHVGYGDRLTPTLSRVEIDDCDNYGKIKHRISVDTRADYLFMAEVYRRWYKANDQRHIVDLKWVQDQLISDPSLPAINAHVQQKAANKAYAKASIYCHLGPTIGLGHFKRSEFIANALQEHLSLGVTIHACNEHNSPLASEANVIWYQDAQALFDAIQADTNPLCLFDFHPEFLDIPRFKKSLMALKERGIRLIGVDKLAPVLEQLDWLFIPSFYSELSAPNVSVGWQNYLLDIPRHCHKKQQVLVMTGGSDALNYGRDLPSLLADLPLQWPIVWVQGPLAPTPNLPANSNIKVVHNPDNLHELISESEIILSCYGLSLFEAIFAKAATILLPPQDLCASKELQALQQTSCCEIAATLSDAVTHLSQLQSNPERRQALQANADRVFNAHQGAYALINGIERLMEQQE